MALSRPFTTAISPLGRQNQAPLAAYGLNRWLGEKHAVACPS